MSTDAHLPTAGGLAAEIRTAVEAMNRRTGYLGPSVHQLERWAAEAERLEASHTANEPEADDAINLPRDWIGSRGF